MHVNHVDAIHFRMDGDGTFHFGMVDQANIAEENKATDASGTEGVMELLDKLVQEAIASRPTPKYILLPIRAAKDAGVLPTADLDWVNKRYGLSLSPTNWSSWVNKEDCGYSRKNYPPW